MLRARSSTVPNAIAAFLLHLRDTHGEEVHCYFNWTQGSPIVQIFRYVLLGEGTSLRSLTKYLDRPSRTSYGVPFPTSSANERWHEPVVQR